jgi:hypothetical protein
MLKSAAKRSTMRFDGPSANERASGADGAAAGTSR